MYVTWKTKPEYELETFGPRIQFGLCYTASNSDIENDMIVYMNILQFGNIDTEDKIVKASRSTADRWVWEATAGAQKAGAIAPGRKISIHTPRHSYARHLLTTCIPINYLSQWLGHSPVQTTLIYVELVPDPTGSLAMVS